MPNVPGAIVYSRGTLFWTLEYTLFEHENERQKIEPVPLPLPRASGNFPDVKTRNDFFFIIGLLR